MNYFPRVERWTLPDTLLEQSITEMAQDGRFGNEGTCLWLGERAHGEAKVSHVVFLRGEGISKSPANVTIRPELMRDVHEQAEQLGVILVGQIHTHGFQYGVNFSEADHAYGVSVPFFLSLVCPDFAQNPSTTLLDCGIHVCIPERGYVRLSPREVKERITLIPGQAATVLFIGGEA